MRKVTKFALYANTQIIVLIPTAKTERLKSADRGR